ncbi:MAG: NAD(P)-dependent oxidoreductase [Muribaculum sp.]|nr:NAD(P)-dependent oxidoreductase [Muribaculum sp.]
MEKEIKRVLVVGAGGFAGGHIVEEALRRGYDVTAGVRASTSRRYLTDERIKFLELDFDNPSTLAPALEEAASRGGKWHYIVYNLGATKCLRFVDFNRINYCYLQSFTKALHESDTVPEKMLYISSLSAMGKGDEKNYTPFTEEMIPRPDTRYGASKLKAEVWLATAGIPTVIFRATGLYGPRDKDYFLMFESIKKGFDFSVGYRRQELSFLYITDLARGIFDALEKAPAGETYNVAEGKTYSQKEFRRMAARKIGQRFVVPMRMPLWIVKTVCGITEKIGVARGKPSTLNRDKYRILAQRNWAVDISKARRDFGFTPRVNLEEGIGLSIDWYKAEGWM